jgi:hypothetical protein
MFVFHTLEIVAAFAAIATPVLAQAPATACTPYYDPTVGANIHNFPTVWQPATLLANDSAGQAMWNKIAGSIPNIPPKGQLNGSTINVTYNTGTDSDCCESLSPPLRNLCCVRVMHGAKGMQRPHSSAARPLHGPPTPHPCNIARNLCPISQMVECSSH